MTLEQSPDEAPATNRLSHALKAFGHVQNKQTMLLTQGFSMRLRLKLADIFRMGLLSHRLRDGGCIYFTFVFLKVPCADTLSFYISKGREWGNCDLLDKK